jgi:hypothetical protein
MKSASCIALLDGHASVLGSFAYTQSVSESLTVFVANNLPRWCITASLHVLRLNCSVTKTTAVRCVQHTITRMTAMLAMKFMLTIAMNGSPSLG